MGDFKYQNLVYFLNNGDGFRDVFEKEYETVMSNYKENKPIRILNPMIVNGAFAVELYLKVLYGIDKTESDYIHIDKTHKNKELLESLSDDIKNGLLKECCSSKITMEKLEELLCSIDCVKWRYEPNKDLSVHIISMHDLIDLLAEYTKKVFNEKFDETKCDDNFHCYSIVMA